MSQFNIREATAEDFDQVSPLTIMAIEDLANQFTASDNIEIVRERMKAAYNTPNTRFSKEFAVIVEAELHDKSRVVAGVGFAYPGQDLRHLTQGTLDVCRAVGAKYDDTEAQSLLDSKDAEFDEFYIDNLAVYEAFRGQGVAKEILAALEKEGKQKGFHKISILADLNNPRAKAIYEKAGYVADKVTEFLGHKYYHLVKIV